MNISERLPRDAAVEPIGTYSQRFRNFYPNGSESEKRQIKKGLSLQGPTLLLSLVLENEIKDYLNHLPEKYCLAKAKA